MPEDTVRMNAVAVGGSFGVKIHLYGEPVVASVLARQLGRPVKWMETRSEHFVGTAHAREQTWRVRAGATRDGRIVALVAEIIADVGSATIFYPGVGPAINAALMFPGPYRIEHYAYDLRCVVTNKTPAGACPRLRRHRGRVRHGARRRPPRRASRARSARASPAQRAGSGGPAVRHRHRSAPRYGKPRGQSSTGSGAGRLSSPPRAAGGAASTGPVPRDRDCGDGGAVGGRPEGGDGLLGMLRRHQDPRTHLGSRGGDAGGRLPGQGLPGNLRPARRRRDGGRPRESTSPSPLSRSRHTRWEPSPAGRRRWAPPRSRSPRALCVAPSARSWPPCWGFRPQRWASASTRFASSPRGAPRSR